MPRSVAQTDIKFEFLRLRTIKKCPHLLKSDHRSHRHGKEKLVEFLRLSTTKLCPHMLKSEMIEKNFESRTTEYDMMYKISELIATYPK